MYTWYNRPLFWVSVSEVRHGAVFFSILTIGDEGLESGGGGPRDTGVVILIHQEVGWFLFFCCSVTWLYLTLCIPMDCSTPGCPSPCLLPSPRACSNPYPLNQWCPPTIIFCCPLLLPPSIFPSIRVFSTESVLRIRWPKYWNFSFSISPSSEYSGLISLGLTGLISLQPKALCKLHK